MKVKELIETLKKFDGEKEVYVSYTYWTQSDEEGASSWDTTKIESVDMVREEDNKVVLQ